MSFPFIRIHDSFISIVATWNVLFTLSAKRFVLRRVDLISVFCSAFVLFHNAIYSDVVIGVSRIISTKLKGITKSSEFVALPSTN